jgi:hypothetical protein
VVNESSNCSSDKEYMQEEAKFTSALLLTLSLSHSEKQSFVLQLFMESRKWASYLILLYFTLPYLTLPYLNHTLHCFSLLYFSIFYFILPYFTLLYFTLHYLTLRKCIAGATQYPLGSMRSNQVSLTNLFLLQTVHGITQVSITICGETRECYK